MAEPVEVGIDVRRILKWGGNFATIDICLDSARHDRGGDMTMGMAGSTPLDMTGGMAGST